MRSAFFAAVLLLSSAIPDFAESETAPPSAATLLAEVVSRLPREPLQVRGDMIVRHRNGVVDYSYKFDMALRWGAEPAAAVYTIRDAFGSPLEQMTVRRAAGEAPVFAYAAGNPLTPAARPGLFDRIGETDLSWTDLALSFLWWQGGSVVATNEVRGRRCYVVEAPAPAGRGQDGGTQTPYHSVRLWIDAEMRMLLQAEGLDAEGRTLRRLWVKSFKKINNTWMIKDLEVQQVNTGRRTKVVVLDVSGASS